MYGVYSLLKHGSVVSDLQRDVGYSNNSRLRWKARYSLLRANGVNTGQCE